MAGDVEMLHARYYLYLSKTCQRSSRTSERSSHIPRTSELSERHIDLGLQERVAGDPREDLADRIYRRRVHLERGGCRRDLAQVEAEERPAADLHLFRHETAVPQLHDCHAALLQVLQRRLDVPRVAKPPVVTARLDQRVGRLLLALDDRAVRVQHVQVEVRRLHDGPRRNCNCAEEHRHVAAREL